MKKKSLPLIISLICTLTPASIVASDWSSDFSNTANASFADITFDFPSEWLTEGNGTYLYLYPPSENNDSFMYFYSVDDADAYFDFEDDFDGHFTTASFTQDDETYDVKSTTFSSSSCLISVSCCTAYESKKEYYPLFDSVLSSISTDFGYVFSEETPLSDMSESDGVTFDASEFTKTEFETYIVESSTGSDIDDDGNIYTTTSVHPWDTIPLETTHEDAEPTVIPTPTTVPVQDEPISNSETVWLSATGEKYHRIPNCGRMNPEKAKQILESDALSMGFDKCSKCY